MEIITKKDKRLISLFESLENALISLQSLLDSYSPPFNGDRFFTDKQLSQRLNLSRRTLQDYRDQGILSYIQLGGKVLYRESDIERLLNEAYRKAFR